MILLSIALFGCHKNVPAIENAATEAAVQTDLHSDAAHEQAVDELAANFQRVHFDFDSSTLNEPSKKALAANAKILNAHPRIHVQLQGHADERGTTDYNLALGQRRAAAVQAHMVMLGIKRDRLPMLSYGEEVPLAKGNDETAWSQNRRCEFRIVVDESGDIGPSTVSQLDE